MDRQRTIKNSTSVEGVGLHTGRPAKLVFKPAQPGTGVTFIRKDLPGAPSIKAELAHVMDPSNRTRRTSIGADGVVVNTIEHIMATLAGLFIDNIIIELDGEEVPGLDGSAAGFVKAINEAEIQEQEAPRRFFSVTEPIAVDEGDASLVLLPSEQFKVSYTLDYNHPLLRTQHITSVVTPQAFEEQFASARTFCLEEEANELRSQGLGKGATYENTLVVGSEGIIKNKPRFADEFARHKALDLIGDLYLLGMPLKAHVIATKSGHSLNMKLLFALSRRGDNMKNTQGMPLDINAIKKILPHRYPFLLVDRIIEMEEDRRAVGIKNVTGNEEFFQGHFPDRPIMPGVLLIESMAQVAGVLMLNKEEHRGKYAYFMAIDGAKFRRPVVPGDQVRLEVEVVKMRTKAGQVHAKALVDGKVAAEADLMFSLVDG